MTPLSKDEAKAFLTNQDLLKLENQIVLEKLQAPLDSEDRPMVTVRGKVIPLFVVLDLVGTL